MSKLIPGVLLLLLGGVSAFSQQPPPNADGQAAAPRNPTGALRQIIPGHYVYSSGTYNSGIIVNAGIRHATGNGRPAAVSATDRQAPIRHPSYVGRTLWVCVVYLLTVAMPATG